METSRREFLGNAARGAAFSALAANAMAQQPGRGIPTRMLGRTGEQVSIIGIGGGHVGAMASKDEPACIRLMHAAIDEGITFFDNAWTYSDGYAEEVMGKALKGSKREKVFLMTKCSGRDEKFARQCLEDSLRRLQTDRLDLYQFHECNYDNDADWIFERGGLKVLLEAQKAGKIRHIGFTGHKDPRIHASVLNKPYEWVSSQMPINPMDHFYRSFEKEIVPLCLAKNVAVIGMKCLGGGGGEGAVIPSHSKLTAEQCVRYALSLPIATLVRGYLSMEEMRHDIRIARDFRPLTDPQRREILALAEPDGGDGRYEMFKTTQRFDNILYRKMHNFPEIPRA